MTQRYFDRFVAATTGRPEWKPQAGLIQMTGAVTLLEVESAMVVLDGWHAIDDSHPEKAAVRHVIAAREAAEKVLSWLSGRVQYSEGQMLNVSPPFTEVLVNATRKLESEFAWVRGVSRVLQTLNETQQAIQTLRETQQVVQDIRVVLGDAKKEIDASRTEVLHTIRTLNSDAAAALNTFKQEAAAAAANATRSAEDAREALKRQGVTDFSAAFRKESGSTIWWARVADCVAGIVLLCLVGLLGFLNKDPFKLFSVEVANPTWSHYVQASAARVVVIALGSWLFARALRNGTALRHAAASNRHKANLCDAFVKLSERLSPEEREKYLNSILPVLAELGSTGYLPRREGADMPLIEAVSGVARGLKNAAK
jgi:phage host-nuclease inhibitor protein Gam